LASLHDSIQAEAQQLKRAEALLVEKNDEVARL